MSVRQLSLLIVFISFSIIGAMIKIPAIVTSVALDSFPALAATAVLGPVGGMITASLGHLGSALLGGLPLGPLHLFVAAEMAGILWVFGKLYQKKKRISAYVFFFVSNGVLAPLPFAFIMGAPFYFALLPALLIGAGINLLAGVIALPKIEHAANRVQKTAVK
ncbi:ECF transporter S component [Bacillus tianshenii]|nr:ECF transporter S component [Bacillus tianshenii]